MPLYDIEHVVPLSATQQESLAVAFTSLHSARFNVPRVFINVRFTDASRQVVFRGGRRVLYNRLILRTRASEKRGKDVYDAHCRDLITAWAKVVLGGDAEGDGSGGEELKKKELRTVWVLGALTTAVECGIARPRVRFFFVFFISFFFSFSRVFFFYFSLLFKLRIPF